MDGAQNEVVLVDARLAGEVFCAGRRVERQVGVDDKGAQVL
jgi:hypothetical protein